MFTDKWLQLLQMWMVFMKQMLSLVTFDTSLKLSSRWLNYKKQKTHEEITGEAKGFDPIYKAVILVNNIFLMHCRKHSARVVSAILPGLTDWCHPALPGSWTARDILRELCEAAPHPQQHLLWARTPAQGHLGGKHCLLRACGPSWPSTWSLFCRARIMLRVL